MISLRSLTVLAVDLAASALSLALEACHRCAAAYRRIRGVGREEAIQAHPSGKGIPAVVEPRPFTEDELEEAWEEHLSAQARALLVDKAGWRYPPASLLDIATCEAIGALPCAEVRHGG